MQAMLPRIFLSILFGLGLGGALFAQRNSADSVHAAALETQAGIWVRQSNIKKAWECLEKAAVIYRSKGDKNAEAKVWIEATQDWPTSWKPARDARIEGYTRARRLFIELRDTLDAIQTLKTIADLHLSGNELALAKQELLEVQHTFEAIKFPQIYYTFDLLRAVCKAQGDIAGEIYYAIRMLGATDSAKTDNGDLVYFNLRMAEAYRDADMSERSLQYTEKAFVLDSGRQGGYPLALATAAYGLDLVQNDSAARALGLLAPFSKDDDTIAAVHVEYVRCLAYTALGKVEPAERSGLRCLELADSFYAHRSPVISPHALALFCTGLAEVYILRGAFNKAAETLDRIPADPTAPKYLVDLRRLALDRFRVDSGLKRFDSALYSFRLYKLYSDSLTGIAKAVRFAEINTKYETEKKDRDILLLEKDNRLALGQVRRSRFERNTLIGGVLLLMVICGLGYSRYRIKKKHGAELERQQREILGKNAALERLLQENQWLLREVHHRVKNNLQMVTSLLQSQSAFLTDPKALDAVNDSQSRVRAMALIHQRLYKGVEVSTIDMDDYITDLVDSLRDTVQPGRSIAFDVRIEKLSLDVSQAISVGLILNEVITNSIKHAFDGRSNAVIRVWLKHAADGNIELFAADNGRGLPPDYDIDTGNSFGFRLIRGLAQDLEAKLTLVSRGGVEYSFRFQRNEAAAGHS